MYGTVMMWLIQQVPSSWIRKWPLNKWYEVREDKEAALAAFDMKKDFVVDTKTGILTKGSPRVQ